MVIREEIKPQYEEKEIHVCSAAEDAETKRILSELHTLFDDKIVGISERGDRVGLSPSEIIYFAAEGQKVLAGTEKERFTVPLKLYELEEKLSPLGFVRISKAEIVNSKKIRRLDMSLTGTIKVIMAGGYETYTSRRNVSKIKGLLVK